MLCVIVYWETITAKVLPQVSKQKAGWGSLDFVTVGTIKTVETLDVGLNVLLYYETAMSCGGHRVEEGYGLNLKRAPQAHVLNVYSLAGTLFPREAVDL